MQLETDVDRFVWEQLQPHLVAPEQLLCAAYLVSNVQSMVGAARAKAYWAAFSDRRLFLIAARVGAFRPLVENQGVQWFDRAQLVAGVRGNQIYLQPPGAPPMELLTKKTKLSSAGQFMELLSTYYGQSEAGQELVGKAQRGKLVGLAAGLLLAAGYLVYQFHYARAGVVVNCQGSAAGIECTVRHDSGGADAEACWTLVVTCVNGTRAQTHVCRKVEVKQVEVLSIPEADLAGMESCDTAASLAVVDLEVK